MAYEDWIKIEEVTDFDQEFDPDTCVLIEEDKTTRSLQHFWVVSDIVIETHKAQHGVSIIGKLLDRADSRDLLNKKYVLDVIRQETAYKNRRVYIVKPIAEQNPLDHIIKRIKEISKKYGLK